LLSFQHKLTITEPQKTGNMMPMDTAEIQFYMRDSEAFRRLIKEKGLTLEDNGQDGICSPPDGGHYLFAIEKRVEAIEFYVHEFTELVVKALIMQEIENIRVKTHLDCAQFFLFGYKKAHELSQETEGDKLW